MKTMVAQAAPKEFIKKRPAQKVPEYLIYEIMDGKPIYYKGYKEVLKNAKKPADIMGSSSLQWKILSYLLRIAFKSFPEDKFEIATNEPGLHIDHRNNLAGDILIYKKDQIPAAAFGIKYTAVAAMVHIEVDVTADTEDSSDLEYMQNKIDTLLAFGTGKIIWIFSMAKKVLVVSQEKTWHWYNLDETIALYDSVDFNIGNYLQQEGIVF